MKKDITETTGLLKRELVNFREEVSQKIQRTYRVMEMEQGVCDVEEWSAKTKEELSCTLELQQDVLSWQ